MTAQMCRLICANSEVVALRLCVTKLGVSALRYLARTVLLEK